MKRMLRLTLAASAAVAVVAFGAPPSHAGLYGNQPWCAVMDEGGGNLTWQCEFATQEDCIPAVLAGNRGYCSRNPYWPG
jgi:hypothetical protein